jgi:hypothetical protein
MVNNLKTVRFNVKNRLKPQHLWSIPLPELKLRAIEKTNIIFPVQFYITAI